MQEVNIEFGFPTSAQAMTKLTNEIITYRRLGQKSIKIIHGYGSSGTGGTIKSACKQRLIELKRNGTIRDFCEGERFNANCEEGIRVTTRYPQLKGDRDWKFPNSGITIVIF